MTTTAVDPVFVDTNILIYARAAGSPFHALASTKLRNLAAAGHPLWTSRQVLREYLATMSRPGTLTAPLAMATLISDVQVLGTQLAIAEDGAAVMARLLMLFGSVACAGRQIHDANIVATMLTHGISRLLTHNIADFQRYSALVTLIPLTP
jgi:predicted nucleic acid-binding protein